MAKPGWISLNEYASKHKVSVSTLRRRIKKEAIQAEMIHGKYWVKDMPLEDHELPQKQAQTTTAPAQELRAEPNQDELESLSQASLNTVSRPPTPSNDSDASILTVTQDLLGELKKAYMQVLQEKEEQILLLKSEIDDLQTLVSALESDNQRLRSELQSEKVTATQRDLAKMSFIERAQTQEDEPHPMPSSDSWLELE